MPFPSFPLPVGSLLGLVSFCAWSIAKISTLFAGNSTAGRAHVVLAPSLEGSGGDQAMLDVLLRRIRREWDAEVVLLSYHGWERYDAFRQRYGIRVEYLSSFILRPFRFGALMKRTAFFTFVGADIVDGGYGALKALLRLAVVRCFAAAGAKSAIISFSFSGEPARAMVSALRAMPEKIRLCVRDPVSADRVESIVGRPVVRSADLAFLLAPDRTGTDAEKTWIEAQKATGRVVVGVCVNALFVKDHAADAYSVLVDKLLAENESLAVLIIPHDFRKNSEDLNAAKSLFDSIDTRFGERIFILDHYKSAGQLKTVAGLTDTIVSGRMHFAIAGLGQGVPAFCIRYQGKFEGIFALFGLADYVGRMSVDVSDVTADPGRTAILVSRFLDTRAQTRAELLKKLPDIRALSENNFCFEDP